MIFIWKANRAKTKVRDRLKSRAGTFDKAVARIAASLTAAKDNKERLRILMQDWGLKLSSHTKRSTRFWRRPESGVARFVAYVLRTWIWRMP